MDTTQQKLSEKKPARGPQALHDLHKEKLKKREEAAKAKKDKELENLTFKPDLTKKLKK